MNLGKRILQERTRPDRDWTQLELSEATGGVISQQSIHLLEVRNSRTCEHLFALADALMVEARWLMTGEGPKEKVPEASIAAVFPSVDPEKWDAIGPRRQGIVEEKLRLAIEEQFASLPPQVVSADISKKSNDQAATTQAVVLSG